MAGRSKYRRLQTHYAGIILALAGALFLTRLDAPLLEPEEARYAEIPRQMLSEGRWLVPVLHGEPYLHKPPLLYWLNLTAYSIFGVRVEAARLVAALGGILVVGAIFLLGRRLIGTRSAFLAALLLLATPRFIYWQRMIITDAWLCVWTTLAILSGGIALLRRASYRRWWSLSALAGGLAVLTKGPVALVLIAVPLFLHDLFQQRRPAVAVKRGLGYCTAAAGVAAPWFVAVGLAHPGGLWDFFWIHHIVRFTAPIDHAEPFWFYVPHVTLGFLPVSAVAVPLIRDVVRRKAKFGGSFGLFFLAMATCVGFFSLSGCKRPIYILPTLPMAGLCAGAYLSRAVSWRIERRLRTAIPIPRSMDHRWAIICSKAVLWATILGYCVAGVVGYIEPISAVPAVTIALVALGVVVLGRRWSSHDVACIGCGCTSALALWMGVAVLLPAYNARFGLYDDVQRVASLVESPEVETLFSYPRIRDSLPFYLQRRVEKLDDAGIASLRGRIAAGISAVIFLPDGRDYARLHAHLSALGLPVRQVIRGRKMSAVSLGYTRLVSCR